MRTFAGIATMPGRPLQRVLRSLRPQVDEIGILVNGTHERDPPGIELADHVIRSRDLCGSSGKLAWASMWDGLYFACDDDLEYPPDYVARMRAEWERWAPRVIVTACGRTLRTDARHWRDWTGDPRYVAAVPEARWINYLGGCAFVFHPAFLRLPAIEPPNEEEAILSAWAQREGVPIRLLARPYDWPARIPLAPGAWTLYAAAAQERFATRSRIIQTVPTWTIHALTEPANIPTVTVSAATG